jgi:hypothetical protein|tara:strand:- start:1919 stop:3052 length:1134 start_codon:yes stop_codon:yes gene_type:complete
MAKEKIEQVVSDDQDSDLLEASEDKDQSLQEFKADADGGVGALASVIPGGEVPEPHSTGSASRTADKSTGTGIPADAQKASVSKASLISQVMGKMNNMSKDTLMKLSGEVNGYGKNKLPASKSQSTGRDPMPKLSPTGAAEAVGEIFDGDDLSEEFRSKATTVFEATVNTKLVELHVHMQEEFSQKLEEDKETFRKELTDRVDEYLDYVTEEWMKENEVAIETALKVEVAETFMTGIKNLFTENYISVPEEKVDLVDELEKQKEELEGKLEEQVNKSIDSKNANDELERYKTFSEACAGLTMTQVDKLSKLSEGIEYESNDEFKSKIDLLKEHYFTNKSAKTEGDLNSEPVELDSDEPQVTGSMAAYTSAISRSVRK